MKHTPSEAQVERAIISLECDEQEAEALRRFYARERAGYKFRWWPVTKFCLQVMLGVLFIASVLLWLAL